MVTLTSSTIEEDESRRWVKKKVRGARSPCYPGARGAECMLFSSRGSRVTVIFHVEQLPFFLVSYLWILGAQVFFYFGFIIYIPPLISTRVHYSQLREITREPLLFVSVIEIIL